MRCNFTDTFSPRKVTTSEAGSKVIELRVDSLEDLGSIDPNWFVPSAEMKAKGAATDESGALKINLPIKPLNLKINPDSLVQPVIVFGLLTPSGQIVEVHSLQPSDPNSGEAVRAAQAIHMAVQTPPGAPPQQHHVFAIARFISGSQ